MSDDETDIDALWASIEDELYPQTGDAGLKYNDGTYPAQFVLVQRNEYEPASISSASSNESSLDTLVTTAEKSNEEKRPKRSHSCAICQKVFCSRGALKEHLERIHVKTNELFCGLCPKICSTRTDMIKHIRTSHGKTEVKYNLERHKLTHAGKTECTICNKTVANMKDHMLCHKPKVTCTICQAMIQPHGMKTHTKTHQQKCEDCEETFMSKAKLRTHKLREHFDGKLFECHCGSVYTSKKLLKAHQLSHNEEATCDVCHKQFHSVIALKSHQSRQHGALKEKNKVVNATGPFICDKCGLNIWRRGSFREHFSQHRNTRMLCDLCPRSFNLKCHLANHMMRFHLKLRPFQCDTCQHKAFSRYDLEKHKLQHGLKAECKICHKLVFNIREHLETHIKAKCPICGKVFTKRYLRKHLKTHTRAR